MFRKSSKKITIPAKPDYSVFGDPSQMADAIELAEALRTSDNKYVRHRDSRPVYDLRHMIRTSSELYGNNCAFMQRFEKDKPFREITYREAMDDVNALGTALIERGLKDKRIAVIGENCYQWAISYLAVVCGTGIVVPLDKELDASELEQLAITAEVSAVFCTKRFESLFLEMMESGKTRIDLVFTLSEGEGEAPAAPLIPQSLLIQEGKKLLEAGDRRFLDAEINPEVMSILLFTSGTTGIAKGVMLSHKNICTDLMTAPTILKVHDWDIFFSVLPLHHTYECTCGFLMPLYKGASIAYCEGLKYIVSNLKEIRPTMILAVPLIFESIYKNIMKKLRKAKKYGLVMNILKLDKISSKVGLDIKRKLLKDIYAVFGDRMRVLISGGAAIDPAVLDFFNDLGFIAVQGYGLTESSPIAALNPDLHEYMRNASVGHVLPTLEAKIHNPNSEGIGEICIKGNTIMLGYYNMPEETAEVLRDGWFHTGDLGYIDNENFIYITGRAKNVIIAPNGKNVFPEELEYYLGRIPYIAESMVWAKKDADGHDGTIIATILPDFEEIKEAFGEDALSNDEATENLIQKAVDEMNTALPLYKQIRRIVIRKEDFDKTTGKKIKRFVEENKEQGL